MCLFLSHQDTQKTKPLRRSQARAAYSPSLTGLATHTQPSAAQGPRMAMISLKRLIIETIPPKHGGWGSLEVFGMSTRGQATPALASALYEVTPPRDGTLRSALPTPSQQCPPRKEAQDLACWAGQGWAGAATSITGVVSFLRRPRSARISPLSRYSPWKGPGAGQGSEV